MKERWPSSDFTSVSASAASYSSPCAPRPPALGVHVSQTLCHLSSSTIEPRGSCQLTGTFTFATCLSHLFIILFALTLILFASFARVVELFFHSIVSSLGQNVHLVHSFTPKQVRVDSIVLLSVLCTEN